MSKKIMVFDTETIGVDKKFCYNVGYVIADINDKGKFTFIDKKEFMVKQVWYNKMLYSTAYYANKKPIYTKRIREKQIAVLPFEEVINIIMNDIEKYNIDYAYAYNSNFDKEVFEFMSEWFRTINPFDEINIFDIRAYFMKRVENSTMYKDFCEKFEKFTESNNYSTTAETAYQFVSRDIDFTEEHTALNDSIIEAKILEWCYEYTNIFEELKAKKSLPREKIIDLVIDYKGKKTTVKCSGFTVYRKRNTIKIK